ncbi:unnamed protein product [Eruca vesicaria subsp. sativa]|uniref:Small ribosomal subunit protein uS3 C-terminal domain-containing protein n=1 Tax=Eruca vesicaria subsp. sativa TaxID=29727 RepID=A0ABC8KI72_ERUVS|nr:unnamed protein product [Eruca vesicaria subsp. sativa]
MVTSMKTVLSFTLRRLPTEVSVPFRGRVSPLQAHRWCCRSQACYGVLRFVMENGAKGCEVIVSGKLGAARAKSMKFKDGYMVTLPKNTSTPQSDKHVLLSQVKVRYINNFDP